MKKSINNAESCAGDMVSGAAFGFPNRPRIALFRSANFTNVLRVAYSFRRCVLV
jgi:hypothetical protein